MIDKTTDVGARHLSRYSAIIDVRSPSEFAADHLPGAINLPVLSDDERVNVGTIYKQQSRFLARRIGAACVARNIAHHLETALKDADPRFWPLLYCWRGGMRSNAMATILSQIGWRVTVLEGGYKTWRRIVVATLFDNPASLPFVLIGGKTGVGKTEIIRATIESGAQAIDLEGLAEHKGSVFGANPSSVQPSQKLFESRLFGSLSELDSGRPIFVEAESSRIGKIVLPKRIWSAMRAAPIIEVDAEQSARTQFLVDRYADFYTDAGALELALDRLRPYHSKEVIAQWKTLAAMREFRPLAAALMENHYDPRYARTGASAAKILARISAGDLSDQSIDRAARKAIDAVSLLNFQSPP